MRKLPSLLAFGFTLLLCSRSEGRVFVVRDTADSLAPTSLRGAIVAANGLGGHNVIMLAAPLDPGTHTQPAYRLTLPGPNEDKARTGDLDITGGELIITGISTNTVIDASELSDRAFQIFPHARLTLSKLTIRGGRAPGSDYASVKGWGNGGAINNAGTLTLIDCTFADNASGPGTDNEGNGPGNAAGHGGAIFNSGTLSITRCSFLENFCGDGINSSDGGNGGAIANSGNCTATLCTFRENRTGAGAIRIENSFGEGGSGGSGGAVFNSGILSLKNCVIAGNGCGSGADGGALNISVIILPGGPLGSVGGNGGKGGGVFNSGRMEVDRTSIFDNVTGNGGRGGDFGGHGGPGGSGGGIYNSGQLIATSSTLSGNSCGNGGGGGNGDGMSAPIPGAPGGSGGGIYNLDRLNLTSCSIALNRTGNGGPGGEGQAEGSPASNADSGAGGAGGGICVAVDATATMRNTLVALNTNGFGTLLNLSGVGPDVAGAFISQGFNLLGIADGSAGFADGNGADLTGTLASPLDPLIGPLQMNGGSTPTHALLPNSPAIDQGDSFKIHKDQRGARRPVNLRATPNATGGDGSDIGAFEAAAR